MSSIRPSSIPPLSQLLLITRAQPTLTLVMTLCEEKLVRMALRVGTLGTRSAALISSMFRSLYGEESVEFTVVDPGAWGLDKVDCF